MSELFQKPLFKNIIKRGLFISVSLVSFMGFKKMNSIEQINDLDISPAIFYVSINVLNSTTPGGLYIFTDIAKRNGYEFSSIHTMPVGETCTLVVEDKFKQYSKQYKKIIETVATSHGFINKCDKKSYFPTLYVISKNGTELGTNYLSYIVSTKLDITPAISLLSPHSKNRIFRTDSIDFAGTVRNEIRESYMLFGGEYTRNSILPILESRYFQQFTALLDYAWSKQMKSMVSSNSFAENPSQLYEIEKKQSFKNGVAINLLDSIDTSNQFYGYTTNSVYKSTTDPHLLSRIKSQMQKILDNEGIPMRISLKQQSFRNKQSIKYVHQLFEFTKSH